MSRTESMQTPHGATGKTSLAPIYERLPHGPRGPGPVMPDPEHVDPVMGQDPPRPARRARPAGR